MRRRPTRNVGVVPLWDMIPILSGLAPDRIGIMSHRPNVAAGLQVDHRRRPRCASASAALKPAIRSEVLGPFRARRLPVG